MDQDQRIFHLDLNRSDSARDALEQSLTILGNHPEIWAWDWIVDAQRVPEDASVEQIARLAEVFATVSATRPVVVATTAFVSADRYLHLWARVMDYQFPKRKHLVVTDVAQAVKLIASRRVGR
jgi:hypothetical protein